MSFRLDWWVQWHFHDLYSRLPVFIINCLIFYLRANLKFFFEEGFISNLIKTFSYLNEKTLLLC